MKEKIKLILKWLVNNSWALIALCYLISEKHSFFDSPEGSPMRVIWTVLFVIIIGIMLKRSYNN